MVEPSVDRAAFGAEADTEWAAGQWQRLLGAPEPSSVAQGAGPGDVEAVFAQVTAYRWRRSAVDAETAHDIRTKIARAVERDAPICFSLPFGGYKAWHQSSYPYPDWAEAMWVEHLRRFAAQIAGVHRPGVCIDLTYYSHALDLANNMPSADQDAYVRALSLLLARRSTPDVRLRLVDLAPLHGSVEQFRADFLEACEAAEFADVSEAQLVRARRNLMPRGVRDLTELTPAGWEAEVARSARAVAAMESLPPRRAFNKYGDHIQIGHIRGPALTLHMGSTRASTMQPWVGTGYISVRDRGPVDTVVSSLPDGVELMPTGHDESDLGPAFAVLPVLCT